MISRMVRAALLNADLYEEIERALGTIVVALAPALIGIIILSIPLAWLPK